MDAINSYINEIVRQQREYTEKSLAEIIEKYDFIVCSTECMNQLQEILPEGAKIAYSPYIGDPATIYVIKKFDMMDLLNEALNKKETPKREEISEAVSYIKSYRKLDENMHNTAPKGSVSFYATKKCLHYWDMAIEALQKYPCEDAISREDTLKPCPFCGTKVKLEKIPLWHGSHGYRDCYEFKICCEKCGCTLTYSQNDTIYRSEKEAIKKCCGRME